MRVSVDGAIPSAAATSPSRIGPKRSTVASADSCVGVSPASSWWRRRRDSRAIATRSRVASMAATCAEATEAGSDRRASAPVRVAGPPSAGGCPAGSLTAVSRAILAEYALAGPSQAGMITGRRDGRAS
jgi:hypothetical protein